jgi:hypothetical protein
VDSVLIAQNRRSIYSKATDLPAAAQLKTSAQHEKCEAALKTIEPTGPAVLRPLGGIRDSSGTPEIFRCRVG